MPSFFKSEACPSSHELLQFQTGGLRDSPVLNIERHLGTCEFCSAEVDFYSSYPQGNETEANVATKIPAPLYELAEALLQNRQRDPSSLNALLKDKKSLVTDKT